MNCDSNPLIEYLIASVKMKRKLVEEMDSRDNQLLSYKRVGMMAAYNIVLEDLDQCRFLDASNIMSEKETELAVAKILEQHGYKSKD